MGATISMDAIAPQLAAIPPSVAFGLEPLPPVGSWPWPVGGLDPVATASGSLAGLNGCATMAFGLMVNKLKEVMPGSVWQAIGRRQLRRAFSGGDSSCSECGGLQGPLFMMTLVGVPVQLKQEFCRWYCEFAFPSAEWDDLYPMKNTVQVVSKSMLCQESRNSWESVFTREIYPATGVYDNTRCSKLPRDCAKKAVKLINDFKVLGHTGAWVPGTH